MSVSSPATVTYMLQAYHRDPSNQFPLITVYQRALSTDKSPTLITFNLQQTDVDGIEALPSQPGLGAFANLAQAIDTWLVSQGVLNGTVKPDVQAVTPPI